MITRDCYRIEKAGSINNLKLITENISEPLNDEVTVQVKAIGLNFADFFCIQGFYKAAPKKQLIPGLEFSGRVIKKGKNVTEFSEGDDVIGVTKFGAFVTHINLNKNYLIKLPDGWSYKEGSAFIVQVLTAYYALLPLGNLQPNQTVLIHSAAGGVGIYANRIAKKFECTTIGTVGSASKLKEIENEGFDKVFVRDENFITGLKTFLNGRQLSLILEALLSKYFHDTFKFLAPTGRAIIYGASNFATHSSYPNYFQLAFRYFKRPKIDLLTLIELNKSVMGFNLIWLYEKNEYMRKLLEEVIQLKLDKPKIGKVYSFKEMIDAIKFFQSGKSVGKVVVIIE